MIRLKLLLMLAPVLYAKIKNLDFNRKTMFLVSRSNRKRMHNACISSEFVQVKKVGCYVITAKRASHRFVLEATNISKNIDACLKHEAKVIRWGLNPSSDERHRIPLPWLISQVHV